MSQGPSAVNEISHLDGRTHGPRGSHIGTTRPHWSLLGHLACKRAAKVRASHSSQEAATFRLALRLGHRLHHFVRFYRRTRNELMK